MRNVNIVIFAVALAILASCEKSTNPEGAQAVIPVYVTVAGHIEDTPVYADCDAYPTYRAKLLAFAEMLSTTGAAFNLQLDYEFLEGVSQCETEAMRLETGGLNVIDYLAQQYGFEVDAHQEGGTEEGKDNYADVRYLGGTLTELISDNVGGMVWDDSDQFARLARGESGLLHPQYTWFPEVLTLAVGHLHHHGDFSKDDVASGIWKPKGANQHFWEHEDSERMVYIGPGEHTDWGREDRYLSSPEFVAHLVEGLADGSVPCGRMYTVTMAVPQKVIFDSDQHAELACKLDEIAPYAQSGRVRFATYSEIVDIWKTEYDSEPHVYYRHGLTPPQDLP
jgi:hypothetical protein